MPTTRHPYLLRAPALLCASLALGSMCAQAQQMPVAAPPIAQFPATGQGAAARGSAKVPQPSLVAADPGLATPVVTGSSFGVDVLGQSPGSLAPAAPAADISAVPVSASSVAIGASGIPPGLGYDGMAMPVSAPAGTERVEFRRTPIRVELPLNAERLVTLPGVVALRTPQGFDTVVRSQIIEGTAYLTALSNFGSLRVIAEDVDTGRQIPLDLVSVQSPPAAPLEVIVPGAARAQVSGAGEPGEAAATRSPEAAPLDMVALTRYAAQTLYAPRRLMPGTPGVRQVSVPTTPVEGLYRGWRIETTPIGSWRSGQLYVTAVRFVNRGTQPVDLDMNEIRGHWLAATAQHSRLLPGDNDWNTTAVYLVCDRPFAACQ